MPVGAPTSMSEYTTDASTATERESSLSQGRSTSTASDTPSSTDTPTRLIEIKLAKEGFFRLEHPDLEKPRHLDLAEKTALAKLDATTTEKALSRQATCWHYGCERAAIVWVREVCFDFKGEKAAPVQHKQISSADYPGPVPGFCLRHEVDGPPELAAAVYWNRPEIAWGAKPTRWWVVFTDGLKQGGECLSFDPEQKLPTIVES